MLNKAALQFIVAGIETPVEQQMEGCRATRAFFLVLYLVSSSPPPLTYLRLASYRVKVAHAHSPAHLTLVSRLPSHLIVLRRGIHDEVRLRQRRQHAEVKGENFRAGSWMSATREGEQRGSRFLSTGRKPRDSRRFAFYTRKQLGVVVNMFRFSREGSGRA